MTLDLFYGEKQIEVIEQQKAYTWQTFMSKCFTAMFRFDEQMSTPMLDVQLKGKIWREESSRFRIIVVKYHNELFTYNVVLFCR